MVLARLARRACLVVVLSLIPASVLAQGASTATIAGVVRDPSGGVLPGVTIEAASPALIEKVRTTVSDDRGQYRFPELRPGVYTVTFSLPGFATVKNEGIELRTNFTAQIDAELKVWVVPAVTTEAPAAEKSAKGEKSDKAKAEKTEKPKAEKAEKSEKTKAEKK